MLISVGLFASLGKAMTGDSAAGSSLIVLGVFIGSAMWWLILSTIVGALHRSVTPRMMRWINVSSGLLIAGFGVVAMVRQWRG
jgi:threonine/homoserine/homoserine lactone efflux protein